MQGALADFDRHNLQVPDIPEDYVATSFMIVWAGMLL